MSRWAEAGLAIPISPVLPAVTCSVQATYLTGKLPSEHGIVGNGWYFRDECEIKFWRQSNKLVQAPKVWEMARSLLPSFTCANLFWWYNMYSDVDYAITPRPMYPADGRKIPDIYTQPQDWRSQLQAELGQFPLFNFWGPNTSIRCSQWIAGTKLEQVLEIVETVSPTLRSPIILFTYYNPILNRGIKSFLAKVAKVGVRGLVVPDLPLEEAEELINTAASFGIDLTLLVAPTSSKERIEAIAKYSQGFIYLVSVTGVTGVRAQIQDLTFPVKS